ncbi:MAG: LysR family transcriptional regulator [Oscillospiraceae bacterium]|nr:LysR family transcriptional regulator [Oscillospiraceae bacterium]
MNFRNLQYFLAVAEERNITHAANRLFISQQSLSGHIAKLEEELGVPLFSRGQELTPTYAGERLMLIAKRICALEREIYRETDEIRDRRRGRLRLGISYTCGRVILPAILPAFHRTHPLAEFSLVEGNHHQLNEWLRRGEIDVLIGYLPIDVPGAEVSELLQERLFLVCPKAVTDSLFGSEAGRMRRLFRQQPDLHLFRDQPFILLKKGNRIRETLDSCLAKLDFEPSVLLETENIETAFALAEKGMGMTIYPELFLAGLHAEALAEDSPLDFFPLPGADTRGSLAIAFLENGYRSPAVLDFIALCRRHAALGFFAE